MSDPVGPTRPDLVGQLRAELFWDTQASQLDAEDHGQYIIERVAERGELEEMRAVWNYYGQDRITQALKRSRTLSAKTVWFFSALLHVPLESFRSYSPELHHAATP